MVLLLSSPWGCYAGPPMSAETRDTDPVATSGIESDAEGTTGPSAAGADGGTGDESSDASTTGDMPPDPGIEFCPYIGEHDYTHPSDAVFERSEVVRFDVEMDPEDWQHQLDNPDLEEYRAATLTFCGETLEGVGMRFKKSPYVGGDLEDGNKKNPIILDLNRFAPGQKLRGLRKLDLEYGNDKLLVAERLNYELLADHGVNVSRANHAQLYINDEYIGVFTNVERVDRSFANYHWGENDGILYKHSYCGNFVWEGDDWSTYNDGFAGQCYVPKPNDTKTDHAEILAFMQALDETPDEDFPAVYPTLFDVEEYIRAFGALQSIVYLDSPMANANNFYTYYPPDGGPVQIALWDLDGGYWGTGGPCLSNADLTNWDLLGIKTCNHPNLPLTDRLLAEPMWEQAVLQSARDFVEGPFEPSTFSARLDAIVEQVAPALAEDPNRSGDDEAWAADIEQLRSSQAGRAQSIDAQLDGLGIP